MRCATSCASANSASGKDGDTAVTAIALSSNASYAAFASSELSTPPEKATTTLSMERRISSSFSSFSSTVTVVIIGLPLWAVPSEGNNIFRAPARAAPAETPPPPGSQHDRNCAPGALPQRAQSQAPPPGASAQQIPQGDNNARLANAAPRDASTAR